MELLMLNQKQVLTKETLLLKIWGYESRRRGQQCGGLYLSFLRQKAGASPLPGKDQDHPHGGLLSGGPRPISTFSTYFSTFSKVFDNFLGKGVLWDDPQIAAQIVAMCMTLVMVVLGGGVLLHLPLRQAEHPGHQPPGAPAGDSGGHQPRALLPGRIWAGPWEGSGAAHFTVVLWEGPQRQLQRLCHRRHLRQPGGHRGADRHLRTACPRSRTEGHHRRL